MKRILFFGAMVAAAILPTACINNRTCGTSSHLQMTFTRDSVSTKTSAGSLSIAYDAASDHESQLSIAIDEFLSESLGGTYEGDITMCDSLVAFYQRQKSDSMTVFYNEYLADSGIDAKEIIQQGLVLVNGEIDERRGRKLYDGDEVVFDDNKISIQK